MPRTLWGRAAQGCISAVEHVLATHAHAPTDAHPLAVNGIGRVIIQTQQPLPPQPYADNRVGAALIVVDPSSNRTRDALLVERGLE